MKKYELLKDLPNIKKGEIMEDCGGGCMPVDPYKNYKFFTYYIPSEYPDWFREVPEEMNDGRWYPRMGDSYTFFTSYDNSTTTRCWQNSDEDLRIYDNFMVFENYQEEKACAALCLETRKKFFRDKVK